MYWKLFYAQWTTFVGLSWHSICQSSSSIEQSTKEKSGKKQFSLYHSLDGDIKLCVHYSEFFIIMFNIMCFYRENEDRLEKLGKSLSVQSKQYRAKRIDVNVKINGVGYLAEVLGGVLVTLLAFHHKVSILNTFALFWYGNVIPSCYLINFVHNKKSIMNDGWRMTISQLYRKKTIKRNSKSSRRSIKT